MGCDYVLARTEKLLEVTAKLELNTVAPGLTGFGHECAVDEQLENIIVGIY